MLEIEALHRKETFQKNSLSVLFHAVHLQNYLQKIEKIDLMIMGLLVAQMVAAIVATIDSSFQMPTVLTAMLARNLVSTTQKLHFFLLLVTYALFVHDKKKVEGKDRR